MSNQKHHIPMLTPSHYLQAMGIELWQQRQPLTGAAVQDGVGFTTYVLVNSAGVPVAVLGLQDLSLDIGQELAVFKLLDAMLAAIKLRRLPALIHDVALPNTSLVLLMGLELVQQAFVAKQDLDTLRQDNIYTLASGSRLVVTYHPRDLLQHPEHKAKAWEDLKKLKALL